MTSPNTMHERHQVGHPQEREPLWFRSAVWGLAVATGASFLGWCVLNGHKLEAQRRKVGRTRAALAVKVGDTLPSLRLTTLQNQSLSPTASRKWRLLVFTSKNCPACSMELQALKNARHSLRGVQITPVFSGHSLFGAAAEEAKSYLKRSGLPFSAALDADGSALKRLSSERVEVPLSVLVGPEGAVRFVASTYSPSGSGSSHVADALTCFFANTKRRSMALTQWRSIQPLAGSRTPFALQDRTTSLARLSRNRVLIVTFVTGADAPSARRLAATRRVAGARRVSLLHVVSAPELREFAQRWGGSPDALVASRNTLPLFQALSSHQVRRGPVTLVVYKGRVVVGEHGAQEAGEVMEREMSYAALLSGADKLATGF